MAFRKETDKERLRLLAGLKTRPELTLFRFVQDIRQQIVEEFKEIGNRTKETIETEIGKRISEYVSKNINLLKGDKGEKGDSIVGSEGPQGPEGKSKKGLKGDIGLQGPKPIAGIDYKIPEDGKKGEPGENAEGKKGDSGSPDTPEDIRDKIKLLIGDERLPASAIKGLKQIQEQVILLGGDKGRRVYPKTVSTTAGTLIKDTTDSTDATWKLPSQTKLDIEKVYVNGKRGEKGTGTGQNYTMNNANTKIIFNSDSIPDVDDGEVILVDYEEDR